MSEGLRFRRAGAPPPIGGRVAVMSALLLVAAGALWWRATHPVEAPRVVIVEVRGEVPAPGFHALAPPATLHAALRAAGREPAGVVDATLSPGTRVEVEAGQPRLVPMDELLVVGLPVSLNDASATALDSLPGVGPALAAAIVADREANGPFPDVAALDRVQGIGPATVEELRPFLVVER